MKLNFFKWYHKVLMDDVANLPVIKMADAWGREMADLRAYKVRVRETLPRIIAELQQLIDSCPDDCED